MEAFPGTARAALSHAVAKDEVDAVEQAIAYVTMQHAGLEEGRWQCSTCGRADLINRALQDAHDCSRIPDPAILSAWLRLDALCSVVQHVALDQRLPAPIKGLLRRRRRSWLDMVLDFNWAQHCLHCRDGMDPHLMRRPSYEANDVLRAQFSHCRDKRLLFLRELFTDAAPDDASLEATATTLGVRCTSQQDVPVVMRLMWEHAGRVLDDLSRTDLVDDDGATSAQQSAHWQDLAILKRLVSRNAAPLDARDKTGWTPLHSALLGWTDDRMDVVRWLLQVRPSLVFVGADGGEPPIALAVRYADASAIALLLAHAPDLIDCETPGGNSLLHLTAWHAAPEASAAIAELLLSTRPALADRRNTSDETVLCAAARAANAALVRVILRVRPSLVDERDLLGDTVLHAAVNPNTGGLGVGARVLEIARLLVDGSPSLATAVDDDGRTADECVDDALENADEIRALIRGAAAR